MPSALANTVEIAKRCNLSLVLGKPRLPNFPTPDGVSLDDYLVQLSEQGLEKRLAFLFPDEAVRESKREQYYERLRWECKTIIQMGFPGYFLIVQDFINWGKNNGVPVGPGRGSGAGSLVAYALGITDLDPIRYDLLFERFLNPAGVHARLRYRLLPGQPRTRHRLRQGKIRARGREPDRHFWHAGRQGRGARRRPGAGHALYVLRRPVQADPVQPDGSLVAGAHAQGRAGLQGTLRAGRGSARTGGPGCRSRA